MVLVSTFPRLGSPKLLNPARGDLRIARQLIAFKRRCPERVWLLAGNRDINKLRLTAELNDFWRATVCAYRCLFEPKNLRYFLENEYNMNYEDMVRTCWEETHGRGKGKGTIHHQVWHSSPCDIKAAFVTIYVCSTCRHFYIHVAYIFCTFLIFVVFAEMNQVHSGAMRSNQIQSYKSMTYSRCWIGKHPSRWHRGIRPRRASASSVVPTGSTSSAVASLSGKEAG